MMNPDLMKKIVRLNPIDLQLTTLLRNRVIFLTDEIDSSMAYTFNLNLLSFAAADKSRKPIWIIVNCPGGEADQGLGIYDSIKALANAGMEVNILGLGLVASMATAIMQAATRRLSMPSTQFLVHQLRQTSFYDTEEVNQLNERTVELNRLNDVFMKIISDRAGMSLSRIKKICEKKDYWLDTEKALKFGNKGLIDEVITEFPFLHTTILS